MLLQLLVELQGDADADLRLLAGRRIGDVVEDAVKVGDAHVHRVELVAGAGLGEEKEMLEVGK